MGTAKPGVAIGGRKNRQTPLVVLMAGSKDGHQHRCVEKRSHRDFPWLADRARNLGWPSAERSRSRRMSRSNRLVSAAEIGSSKSRTQMPCFFLIPTRF